MTTGQADDGPTEPESARRWHTVARLGADWATDDDDGLWWQQQTRVGKVFKAWPGSGWEAQTAHGTPFKTGSKNGRYPSRIKALEMLAAHWDRRRRQTTPHSDVPADGLPDGWRLTQTLAQHDDHTYVLIAPDGNTAGAVSRVQYGSRPEWRATAGDPAAKHAIRVTVYPDGDDPGRGREPDLWRTRTAAVRGLATRHDPELPA